MDPDEELRLECLRLALLNRSTHDPVEEAQRMEEYVRGKRGVSMAG